MHSKYGPTEPSSTVTIVLRFLPSWRPRGGDWLEGEARALRTAGIELLVPLLEPVEAEQLGLASEAQVAERSGLRCVSFPIPDREAPESSPAAASLVATISAALDAGNNVAVHCGQGIGRSGLIAAVVLMSSGIDPEQSIAAVSAARGQAVPETADQRLWILRSPAHALR